MARVSEESRKVDCELWLYILQLGGLHRDKERWDSRLSINENRRCFRWLDRADDQDGHYLDRMAKDYIREDFPHMGIETGDDLWTWLQSCHVGVRA